MNALQDIDSLAHLDEAQRSRLEEVLPSLEVAAGSKLFSNGDPAGPTFLIKSGCIRLERSTPLGVLALHRVGGGEFVGEDSFLDRSARLCDAVADESTECFVLQPESLSSLFRDDPDLAAALNWAFCCGLVDKLNAGRSLLKTFFSDAEPEPAERPTTAEPARAEIEFEERLRFLRGLGLGPVEADFLANFSTAYRLEPQQLLFREGEPGRRFFFIVEGRIRISKTVEGAGEEAITFLESKETVGSAALIRRSSYTVDATAGEGGATVLAIEDEVLDQIVGRDQPASLPLVRFLCLAQTRRLRETFEKLVGLFLLSGGSSTSLELP